MHVDLTEMSIFSCFSLKKKANTKSAFYAKWEIYFPSWVIFGKNRSVEMSGKN